MANGDEVYTFSPYPSDLSLFSGKLLSLPFSKRYWIGGPQVNEKSKANYRSNIIIKKKIKGFLFNLYNYINIYDRRSLLLRKVSARVFDTTFDVIISSSDPKSVHLFAEKILNENPQICKQWIQYWGDPFTGDISYKRLLGSYRIKKEEKRLLKLADKVVYVSPFTAEDMQNKYSSLINKIHFYPIPYRLSKNPIHLYSFEGKEVVAGYMGDYDSHTRNILPLYKALKKSGIRSYIIGNSDINLEGSKNITIQHRLLGEDFKKMTDMVNVIVCVCNLRGTQIPGKIYHYVNTGKPILIIVDGNYAPKMRGYFESFERFYICDNNELSIYNMLTQITMEKKTFSVPEQLNPQVIAKKILDKYDC